MYLGADKTEDAIGSDPASQQLTISNGIINTDGMYSLHLYSLMWYRHCKPFCRSVELVSFFTVFECCGCHEVSGLWNPIAAIQWFSVGRPRLWSLEALGPWKVVPQTDSSPFCIIVYISSEWGALSLCREKPVASNFTTRAARVILFSVMFVTVFVCLSGCLSVNVMTPGH